MTVRIPLVTGGGRSGTHSVSYYLESIGVPSTHEVVKSGGVVVSWWHAPNDAANLPGKHLGHIETPKAQIEKYGAMFDPVIHVVRDPLDHITSLMNCLCGKGNITIKMGRLWDKRSFSFASKYIPLKHAPGLPASQTKDGPRMFKAACYWLHWNQLAAEHKGVPTKLEDLKTDPSAVESMLRALRLHELPAVAKKGYASADDFIAKHRPLPPFAKLGGVSQIHPDRVTWAALSETVGRELAEAVRKQAVGYGYAEHDTDQARKDASSGPSYGLGSSAVEKPSGKHHRDEHPRVRRGSRSSFREQQSNPKKSSEQAPEEQGQKSWVADDEARQARRQKRQQQRKRQPLNVGDLPQYIKRPKAKNHTAELSAAVLQGARGFGQTPFTPENFAKIGGVARDRGVLGAVDEESQVLKWLNYYIK